MQDHECAQVEGYGSPLVDKSGGAKYLRVCTRTIDNLMKRGELPFVKLGRRVLFRRSDLDRLIAQRLTVRAKA